MRSPTSWPFGTILRASFHTWSPPSIVCVQCFPEEDLKMPENLLTVSFEIWLDRSIQSLLSGLRSCRRVADHPISLVWRWSCGILVPWLFPVQKGLQGSWRDCFVIMSHFREVFSLPSIIVFPWRRRSRGAVFPSLRQAFLYIRLSSYSVEDEIIN